MICTRELTVTYGTIPVLQDINLEIKPGEFVLITGPSGCGKSTLAYALSGLIPHAIQAQVYGKIEICDLDSGQHNLHSLVRHVGIVLQNPSSQLFHLRVEDEIAFGPRNLGLEAAEVSSRTNWAIRATGLEDLRDRKPAELSGGQKQCVAIAAILAMLPKILILDEPTASLDGPNSQRVLETIKSLQTEYGVTIIVIEHRLEQVARLANRLIVMQDGRITADGKPDVLLADQITRNQLGLQPDLQVTPIHWHNPGVMVHSSQSEVPPLLTLKNISAGYHGKNVIEAVNITLYPGDFAALVGNNGAGKSTVGLVAAGLLKPSSGKVLFQSGIRPRPGRDVAMLFQNPADQLFTDSVNEEVAFGPQNYRCYDHEHHHKVLEESDLEHLRKRSPQQISVGQQQRTVLAACLSLKPRLVILDEPTLGQDWGHLRRMMDFLTLLNQNGAAILLISHDQKLVRRYAQRIYKLKHGKVQAIGLTDRAFKPESQISPPRDEGINHETIYA